MSCTVAPAKRGSSGSAARIADCSRERTCSRLVGAVLKLMVAVPRKVTALSKISKLSPELSANSAPVASVPQVPVGAGRVV